MNSTRTYYSGQELVSQKVTAKQERELFAAYAADPSPANRERIVRAYLGFALLKARLSTCWRGAVLSKAGTSEDDAISAANFGLMKAIDRFDHTRGTRFTTYAGWWIKKALHEARYSAHAVTVPRGDRNRFVLWRRQLATGLSIAEVAELNHTTVAEVERVTELAGGRQDPLDVITGGRQGSMDVLTSFRDGKPASKPHASWDETEESPLDAMAHREPLEMLERAKNRLGIDDLRLLHDRFSRNLSLKQIAAKTSTSPKKVRLRLRSVLATLRMALSIE